MSVGDEFKPRRLVSGGSRPKKTAMLLAEQLVRAIVDEKLEPGAKLPSEKEMLERYQVGRGTLREALRYLELQGVLTIKQGPGGGPVFTAPDARHLASTIALLLELSGTPFRDIVEARQVLEPTMARQAAQRITAELLAEIDESVRMMGSNIDKERVFWEENKRFHSLIAWSSNNHVFGHVLSSLRWITDGTALGVDYSEKRRRAVHRAHGKIVEAIRQRNGDEAEKAMQEHLDEFVRYLEKYFARTMDKPIHWAQHNS